MIGKWNKSVILSYIGLSFSVLGMFLIFKGYELKYIFCCFIAAGVCDMFDGTVARRCKRTEEEKLFGIELDSLVDVFSFVAFPIVIAYSLGLNEWYHIPAYILYGIFGVARLAHFNITVEDTSKPRKYYEGLPVTMSALIFPLLFSLSFILEKALFNTVYFIVLILVGILFILKIKIPKPGIKISLLLLILSIIFSILYLFVL